MATSDLLTPGSRLFADDMLKVHCRIIIDGQVQHKTGQGGFASSSMLDEVKNVRQKIKMAQDFGTLYKSLEFADVTITTTTKTFMAHKAVLAGKTITHAFTMTMKYLNLRCLIFILHYVTARSKVFFAMFATEMVESKMCNVDINDFDENVVEGMLEYM